MKYRYLTPLAMLFTTLLLCSNVTAEKLVTIGWFTMPASILIYPLLYTMGSIITEVYGRKQASRITIVATLLNIFMAVVFTLTVYMPAAKVYSHQAAYSVVIGSTFQIVIASVIAFWAGNMINVFLTAALKRANKLSLKWRALVCNLIGLSVDCVIFSCVAFYQLPIHEIVIIAGSYYLFKVCYQLILVSFIRYPVIYLERVEKS